MFPLGTTLLPSAILPLHIFEPRYREMIRDVLDGEREFGVVLIERGTETGGGDVRADVATIAQVIEAEEFEDGRWGVAAVGTRRIRVTAWLPDDPYPQAQVDDWPDMPGEPEVDATTVRERIEALHSTLEIVAALGHEVNIDADIASDPGLAGYQIGVLAPLGAFDRQRILAARTVADRFALLDDLLAEQRMLLRAELDSS